MSTHDPHHDDPKLPPEWKEEVFGPPEGYFEAFGARLQARLQEEAEAPDPDFDPGLKLSRHDPFVAPEGYLEGFAGRLQARIRAEERSVVRPLWGRVQAYGLRAAAAIALLLVAGWLLQRYPSPATPSLAQVPTEDLLAAIEAEDLPADLILEVMDAEAVAALRPPSLEELTVEELLDEVDLEALETELLETYN